ncbi:MAG: SAM-dependent chlorinase/fluorinase [Ktedonobacteraceae bacterium]|nr:SAM-dependent chlorinase/fluorinase [Ktedonobacteraceae bacterium]
MTQQPGVSHPRPVIALLTDFGPGDSDVGVMKGVVATIAPDVRLIDITHDIGPQNVASGAWILDSGYRYFPRNTVFVCVVDPGVGSTRRAIALHAGEWFFVGPDNGLFSYVLAAQPLHAAALLSNPAYQLPQVSSTFHGRDIFAPAGAHLANGVPLDQLGPLLDPASLQRLDATLPRQRGSSIDAVIVHVDHFGNLITSIPLSMVPGLLTDPGLHVTFPQQAIVIKQRHRFFAEAADNEQPFIFPDSSGYVGIAVRNGSAARTLGVNTGAPITLVTTAK